MVRTEPDHSRGSRPPKTRDGGTLARIRFRGDPLADPENVVTVGRARFTLLTPRLLRLEWAETGRWEDRGTYAFPTRRGPAVPHQSWLDGDDLVIDTGPLRLRYKPGLHFSAGNLSIAFDPAASSQAPGKGAAQHGVWRPGLANPSNLRGTRRTLDECAGDAALDEGLISRAGWALFDDSRSVVFGAADGWPAPRPQHECQDWYFFGYGRNYKAALSEYMQFGGQIPLVPRYALGAWWSRYWAYSDQDLKDLVNGFRTRELPLDVLVVDMDWHTPHAWTGYTWNRDLFPDPPAFLQWVHEQGLQVSLNLHPAMGVQPHEEVYPRFAQAMGLDPDKMEGIPFRIADERFVKPYLELLHHSLEHDGVDFWWMDWQQGETSEIKGLDPLIWLNHLHFLDSARRGSRPMLFSRWGGLGNHRYPIGFSGDTFVTWDALQFQPYMTATASNVGHGWWSHDIGGHMGGATEPELFARWVQFGALSPCLRLHATKDERIERRPWKYPDKVYAAVKEAFHLRYRLVPYLYTMARVAHDSGVSLCRPLYYDYPDEEAAYAARYQYMLGDQLIAAPIVFPADPATGLASADVWVPQGTWIDLQTRETFSGPRWVRLVGDLKRVPVLVKAGTILPRAPGSLSTASAPQDHLVLSVFPGPDTAFRLYEDDGLTEGYKDGQFEWTTIRNRQEGEDTWVVEIEPVQGHCKALPRQREYEVRLEGSRRPRLVTVDGVQAGGWTYDTEAMATIIRVPPRDKRQSVEIVAVAEGGISALGTAHNREVILADVRWLLGGQCPANPGDVDAVLNTDAPGRLDAVARLGGPFARFVEFVTPEEASRQLGHVILGAPADPGDDWEARVAFALSRHGVTERETVQVQTGSQVQVLGTPFAHDGRAQTSCWEAEVDLTWRGRLLAYTYRSRPLFPSIHAWRALVYNKDEKTCPLDEVLDSQGNVNGALSWIAYRQEDSPSQDSLTQGYVVRLSENFQEELAAGQPLAGYLATTIISPDDRDVVFEAWTTSPTKWFLNGRRIDLLPAEHLPTAQPPFYRPTRKSSALRLRKGENTLVADIGSPASVRACSGLPSWRCGGSLLTPSGESMTDLVFA